MSLEEWLRASIAGWWDTIAGLCAYSAGSERVAAQLMESLELENAPTMRMEGLQTMSDGALAWLGMAMIATVAAAQTTIQTSGTISAGTAPVFGPLSESIITITH